MIQDYAPCSSCPLSPFPSVKGGGQRGGLMIILDAPGGREIARKQPLAGDPLDLITACLRIAEYRGPVWYTNTVLCKPAYKQKVNKQMIDSCHDRLIEEIKHVMPDRILLCGSSAISVMGWRNVTDSRGAVTTYTYIDREGKGREALVISTWHPMAIYHEPDLFRDFSHDLDKLLRTRALENEPEVEVIIPTTPEESASAMEQLVGASVVACDIETTGFSLEDDEILSIGFAAIASDKSGVSVILTREVLRDPFVKFLAYSALAINNWRVVFHNIKFDIQFLRRFFDDPYLSPKNPEDTLMMAYALDERGSTDTGGRSYRIRGLKYLARVYYNAPEYALDLEWFLGLSEEERDYSKLYRYQALDCYWTVRLYFDMLSKIQSEEPEGELSKLVETLLVPGSLAFAVAESRGIMVDVPYLNEFRERLIVETEEMKAHLADLCGDAEFNPNSHVQVKKKLARWDFTPQTTDRQDYLLEARKDSYPDECKDFVHTLLDYRQKSRVLGTYVEGMLKRVEKGDRVHADFLIHGTDTGRLSARNPNLQNIPVLMGKDVRNIFIVPDGYKLVNADYSQLELRVAAFYSRDEEMMEAFHRDMDIHTWVAALMFKKPMEEITKYERYLAKYLDFGVLYGRGAIGITQGWEAEHMYELTGKRWTLKEAQKLSDDFFDAFPGLRDFIAHQHQLVSKQQYISTPTGRKRRFPFLSRASIGNAKRRAVNSPIQGLASDMALSSVIRLTDHFASSREFGDAFIVSSVHDSIMFEVRDDDRLEEMLGVIKSTMETPCIDYFDVPLRVDIEIGTRWGDLKDA